MSTLTLDARIDQITEAATIAEKLSDTMAKMMTSPTFALDVVGRPHVYIFEDGTEALRNVASRTISALHSRELVAEARHDAGSTAYPFTVLGLLVREILATSVESVEARVRVEVEHREISDGADVDHRDDQKPLTGATVLALAEIIGAARAGASTTWLDENGNQNTGVARHLVTNVRTATFAGPDDDIRDAFLRISGVFEHFLPVSEVLAKMASGEISFHAE